MSPRLAKRGRIGTVSPKTMPPRSAKRARIGKVSSKTMPLRSAKRARIDKVSPKTKEAAVKAEEVVVSVFEAKGENKVEEIIENKPNVVAQGVYEALELRDGGFDYLGKSVLKEAACDIQEAKQQSERCFFEAFVNATRYFTQYYDFCDYLKNECKFIKHDSVPKEVYDSGELPLSRFDMLRENDIIDLLQCYSCIVGSKAKVRIDLESQYSVYLTKCHFIKWNSDASEILRILKEEKKFKDKKFSSLSDDTLKDDLREYIWYLDDKRYNPGRYMGKSFSVVMKKRIEMRNYVEKYTMDEDPLTEMKKQYPNFRWESNIQI